MKKKIVAMCATVAIAALAVGGTLAYFTDTDNDVVNTFTVGNVEINLKEAVVDVYGKADQSGARTEEGNEYKLIPGQTYVKDPKVTVEKTSEPCFVRMMVSINLQDTIDEIFEGAEMNVLFGGYDQNEWAFYGESEKDGVKTYEFRYIGEKVNDEGAVDARDADVVLAPLFTSLNVPGDLTEGQIAELAELEITVVAHAIQSANFANAAAAWDTLDA